MGETKEIEMKDMEFMCEADQALDNAKSEEEGKVAKLIAALRKIAYSERYPAKLAKEALDEYENKGD